MPLGQFLRLASLVVARANAAGVVLADLGVTAEAVRQLRRTLPPLGLRPDPVQLDQARIQLALTRIIGADIDTADTPAELAASRRARVSRFGADEAHLTLATATQRALIARQAGWIREVDADPCPICIDLADGVVRPPTVRMARHRGCACIQAPKFT
jgi:hypothetical protein